VNVSHTKMTEKEGKREESHEAQYREAVQAMERGDESAKTIVAYYKLSGVGGAMVNADEAVALLEERARDGDHSGIICGFKL